ncbi:MAG: bifunctional hydroxymethylpyrimidine kinase/phosphomethylpyrimidine kinase [Candidatus Brocadiaceae bacterium]|jgi:hydroxymethylpyrimidine/phosphomethylpyrimidine kinase
MVARVLTIAGSDSGGGAGIQADLKTITALGAFGSSAITALTAQNTTGVRAIFPVSPEFVALQIDAVAEDIGIDAAKTGMLANAPIVRAVADAVRRHRIRPLVVDPVMIAKSGDPLLEPDARDALRDLLLPLATLLTPNLAEAAHLAGLEEVRDPDAMREAARRIHELGPDWVLVKGGHLEGDPADLLFDGDAFTTVVRPRVPTTDTHGTGCTYSAAIACALARGADVPRAVEWARDALQRALQASLPLGRGRGPLNHAAMFGAGEP